MEILSLMAKKVADAKTGKEQQQKTTGNIYREQVIFTESS